MKKFIRLKNYCIFKVFLFKGAQDLNLNQPLLVQTYSWGISCLLPVPGLHGWGSNIASHLLFPHPRKKRIKKPILGVKTWICNEGDTQIFLWAISLLLRWVQHFLPLFCVVILFVYQFWQLSETYFFKMHWPTLKWLGRDSVQRTTNSLTLRNIGTYSRIWFAFFYYL